MRSTVLGLRSRSLTSCVLPLVALLAASLRLTGAEVDQTKSSVLITSILQLRSLATEEPEASYNLQLEGDVWWANGTRFVLHDPSGSETLEADLSGSPLKVGDRIKLTGHASVVRRGAGLRLGVCGPVIDNDGIHTMLGV